MHLFTFYLIISLFVSCSNESKNGSKINKEDILLKVIPQNNNSNNKKQHLQGIVKAKYEDKIEDKIEQNIIKLLEEKIYDKKQDILSEKLFDIFSEEEILNDNFGNILSNLLNIEEAKSFLQSYIVTFIEKKRLDILKPIIIKVDNTYSKYDDEANTYRYEYLFNSKDFSIMKIIDDNYIKDFFNDSGISVTNFVLGIPYELKRTHNPITISIDKRRKDEIEFYLNSGWDINKGFRRDRKEGNGRFRIVVHTMMSYWLAIGATKDEIDFLINKGAYGTVNVKHEWANNKEKALIYLDLGGILRSTKTSIRDLSSIIDIKYESIDRARKLYNESWIAVRNSRGDIGREKENTNLIKREIRHFAVINHIDGIITQTKNKMIKEKQSITRISLVDRIIDELFAGKKETDEIKAEKRVVRAILFRELSKRDI